MDLDHNTSCKRSILSTKLEWKIPIERFNRPYGSKVLQGLSRDKWSMPTHLSNTNHRNKSTCTRKNCKLACGKHT